MLCARMPNECSPDRADRGARAGNAHSAGIAASAPGTADAGADRAAIGRNRTGHTESARPTTAAHALREDGMRTCSRRADAAAAVDCHRATSPRTPAAAAEAQADRWTFADAAGHAEPAIATAATDALRQNPVGSIAKRGDRRPCS